MQNIKKIFNMLTKILVKNRTIVISLAIQNTILVLIVLIYTNVIISDAKTTGELNFISIKLFYGFMMNILFFLVYIYAPYFLSRGINGMIKNNTFEYLLSTKVKPSELTYALYLRGITSIIVLIFSAFPIASVSFYFGGVGLSRTIKYIVLLLSFVMNMSAICVFISSCIQEINLAILVSYVFCFFVVIFYFFRLQQILNSNIVFVMYVLANIVLSILLIFLASKSLKKQYK